MSSEIHQSSAVRLGAHQLAGPRVLRRVVLDASRTRGRVVCRLRLSAGLALSIQTEPTPLMAVTPQGLRSECPLWRKKRTFGDVHPVARVRVLVPIKWL